MRMGAPLCALFCVAVLSSGCTRERQQPVLPSQSAPVSNSLRAPAAVGPKAKQGRVAMPERRWGVSDGKRPLTTISQVSAAQARSLNDHPEGLQRSQLQSALDAKMGELARCFDNAEVTSVGVYFEADPSGEARGIQVRGAPPDAQACVSSLISALKIPAFKGNPVPVDFPLSIRQRVETITRTGVPTAGDVPPPASVKP